MTEFTIPGISEKDANEVADILQKQLSTYNDLHLTLKHIHWNVVGPNFIGVHEMIDPQVEHEQIERALEHVRLRLFFVEHATGISR